MKKINLMKVSIAYCRWCCTQQEMQHWWRRKPYKGSDGYGLFSNISVGDRFLHPHPNQVDPFLDFSQISLINDQILVSRNGYRYLQFSISHRIGGHWGRKKHEELIQSHWTWLPYLEQLVALGWTLDEAFQIINTD